MGLFFLYLRRFRGNGPGRAPPEGARAAPSKARPHTTSGGLSAAGVPSSQLHGVPWKRSDRFAPLRPLTQFCTLSLNRHSSPRRRRSNSAFGNRAFASINKRSARLARSAVMIFSCTSCPIIHNVPWQVRRWRSEILPHPRIIGEYQRPMALCKNYNRAICK